jgi:chaperonin cofactor prefoldin
MLEIFAIGVVIFILMFQEVSVLKLGKQLEKLKLTVQSLSKRNSELVEQNTKLKSAVTQAEKDAKAVKLLIKKNMDQDERPQGRRVKH